MGLDMWCYAVRALDDGELAEIRAGGYLGNCGGCYAEDADDGMDDILPYCSKVVRRITVQDWDAMEKDAVSMHGGSAEIIGKHFAAGFMTYAFDDGGQVELDTDSYMTMKDVECLEWHQEDVGYWRKEYGLQSAVHKAYAAHTGRDVENCGYHRIDDASGAIEALFGGDNRPYLPVPKDGWAFFYHEWY